MNIEYIRRLWGNGEEITADKLNNIELGISEAKKSAEESGVAADNAQKFIDKVAETALKIAIGTYSGTGESSNTLTFDFAPQFIYVGLIFKEQGMEFVVAVRGDMQVPLYRQASATSAFGVHVTNSTMRGPEVTWGDKTVTLSGFTIGAMNTSGAEYRYFAIG